jgi:hypothetical protein
MMHKKVRSLLFFLLCACGVQSLSADTWKVFFYMDCSDALSDMGIKNITDMMRGAPADNVEFMVQVHAYFDVALRYQVTDAGLVFLDEVHLSGISQQDFINAARWALADNSAADHVMVVASNHGYGILDPVWSADDNKWHTNTDEDYGAACSIKRSCLGISDKEREASCSIKRSRLGENEHYAHCGHKGFMFNAKAHSYLNNQDLIESLRVIQQDLLGGNKIDILAFDTCMGDMLEVAYEVAPYANFLVGNQSCSLLDGFDYQGIVPLLNKGLAPRETAAGMVRVFDAYYSAHDASGIYTHAAVDLSQVVAVSDALDTVVTQLFALPDVMPILQQARADTPRFCMWPMYTDPVAFCKNIEEQITLLPSTPEIVALLQAFQDFYVQVHLFVVDRCGGFTTTDRAFGFAIYLPIGTVDKSYLTTVFANNSQWINLLQFMGPSCVAA